ncbi:tubby C-terminal-like domain-containing protein [Parachaetomium inaequale]|uniref:Tubby C-terminal-like domain-containing protein n=1 Tax=Parachaetomium inaequale TaxID=2588326 RepID=A0AAN6PE39_9PEZI|nr:tubby C-terminal-like domain-containing protein [Parachaetomium inaequale]
MALQTTTLVLKERSFDNFDINDLSGARWMHIEGQIATIHGRKKVFDPRGNYLFDLVKELLHWHTTFSCETGTEPKQQYMQVKSKFSIFSSKANATFTSTTGAPVTLSMKGNWLDTTAEIVDPTTGAVAARIDRKLFNARELLLGRQTYHVTIAPGVDIALIIAMCVCLDEAQNEGQKNACTIL